MSTLEHNSHSFQLENLIPSIGGRKGGTHDEKLGQKNICITSNSKKETKSTLVSGDTTYLSDITIE